MMEKMKLVMATNNAGKLREARAIAGDKLEILSLADIGYHHDIEETADTLAGNALIKVREIKKVTDLDVFADDTGLMVDALGGDPGVYTARYAGEGCTPDDNIELMLKNMEGVKDRHALFTTCIALSHKGKEHLFEGSVEGSIATKRSGNHGFGYDPIFIAKETGKCFADMTDEEKNAISHRGRAVSAMMKWLASLSLIFLTFLPANAASSDWMLFNTFDDQVDNVFDTAEKTYFLVQAQPYIPAQSDNNVKVSFLFAKDKDSGEVRAYNAQNFLSESLISMANYNSQKKYLLIVYENLIIDFLYDDGSCHSLTALKAYDTSSSKEVRSITFDPENDLAYLATDFGFIAINDEKHEVASSGIYDHAIDYVARMGNQLLVVTDGKIYSDDISSKHLSFSDFYPTDWVDGEEVVSMIPLSSSRSIISKIHNGAETHYMMTLLEESVKPTVGLLGAFTNARISENKTGLLVDMPGKFVDIERENGNTKFYNKRTEDYGIAAGSWNLKDYYFAKSRTGFFSLSLDSDGEWAVTSEAVMPNAPAPFRSNNLLYTNRHGMLVNTHGTDFNFSSHLASNPVLLTSWRSGEWTRMGVPYFDSSHAMRILNPCGMAQDPDDPDVFYFGSVANGLLRYNVTDYSSLLQMTRSNDNPTWPGHVSLQEPYAGWGNVFMLLSPRFDSAGNLLVSHVNTEETTYTAELWIWTPEKRRASTSPETFQPFKRLELAGIYPNKSMLTLPLESSSTKNMVCLFPLAKYDTSFVVYDHNGTPEEESDDRQVTISSLYDSDGSVTFHYIFCAIEDPSTGLVWMGTDNGVFTFDPAQQFSNNGLVSRIKVSRNDGTSLADYLLDGIIVNNISIDGKGRKWFALSGGGLVCTNSTGTSILDEITSDDSMLPSDNVYATCYNPDNNSLMIGTENGLCEYYFSSQSDSTESKARAYPNPVGPDYYGWVTIDGLEDDCIVKITDSAGNMIRELGPATNGSVLWDVCNSQLDRVSSGVYFVLASSGPGGGSYSEATKILVVK